ncbi:MAG: hypothetical protein ACETVR_03645 [Candidatus Bathyarchaeia archaeon]
MSSDSTTRDKIDVIDFIIRTLTEHEKAMDELVARLEEILEHLPTQPPPPRDVERPLAICVETQDWGEFKSRCGGAPVVAFEIDEKTLSIYAVKEGVVYAYSEELPEMRIRMRRAEDYYIVEEFSVDSLEGIPLAFRKRLNCGLEGSVRGSRVRLPEGGHLIKVAYDVDVEEAKTWLSKELKVNKRSIIQGKITI